MLIEIATRLSYYYWLSWLINVVVVIIVGIKIIKIGVIVTGCQMIIINVLKFHSNGIIVL